MGPFDEAGKCRNPVALGLRWSFAAAYLPVNANAPPSPIIIAPPDARILASRRGDDDNQAPPAPANTAHAPSDSTAMVVNTKPSAMREGIS